MTESPPTEQLRPAFRAEKYRQCAAGRRNLLPDRTGLGRLAPVGISNGFGPVMSGGWPNCDRVTPAGAPHEILDPRDLKFCCNQCTAHWAGEHDPFQLARAAAVCPLGPGRTAIDGLALAGADLPGNLAGWLVATGGHRPRCRARPGRLFFPRPIQVNPGGSRTPSSLQPMAPSPKLHRLDHYDFLDGPAVRIGIFLSIFNVHINRSPGLPGWWRCTTNRASFSMPSTRKAHSGTNFYGLGSKSRRGSRFAVRVISGLIARRIVSVLRPGQTVRRGEKFGMIKLGSRTELILPSDAVEVEAIVGQKVQAGHTILARHKQEAS